MIKCTSTLYLSIQRVAHVGRGSRGLRRQDEATRVGAPVFGRGRLLRDPCHWYFSYLETLSSSPLIHSVDYLSVLQCKFNENEYARTSKIFLFIYYI